MRTFTIIAISVAMLTGTAAEETLVYQQAARQVDEEIGSARAHVERLRGQRQQTLAKEEKTIELLLEPDADHKAIAAQLDRLRADADLLLESIELAEDHLYQVQRDRAHAIARKVEVLRTEYVESQADRTRQSEEEAARRSWEEAQIAAQRMKQEEKVQRGLERIEERIAGKAFREAAIKRRTAKIQHQAELRAKEAAASHERRTKEEPKKLSSYQQELADLRTDREARRAEREAEKLAEKEAIEMQREEVRIAERMRAEAETQLRRQISQEAEVAEAKRREAEEQMKRQSGQHKEASRKGFWQRLW